MRINVLAPVSLPVPVPWLLGSVPCLGPVVETRCRGDPPCPKGP